MALFKEDGSLDVEWLNNLPIEEFTKVHSGLTRKQKVEFWAKMTKLHGPTKAVDYTLEDELKRHAAIATDFLNQQREKYGLKRQDDTPEK